MTVADEVTASFSTNGTCETPYWQYKAPSGTAENFLYLIATDFCQKTNQALCPLYRCGKCAQNKDSRIVLLFKNYTRNMCRMFRRVPLTGVVFPGVVWSSLLDYDCTTRVSEYGVEVENCSVFDLMSTMGRRKDCIITPK